MSLRIRVGILRIGAGVAGVEVLNLMAMLHQCVNEAREANGMQLRAKNVGRYKRRLRDLSYMSLVHSI
jgi:hypothetical protein